MFISPVVGVPLNVPTDFSGFCLVEQGTGRNERGVVVEWISEWCVCLVSAFFFVVVCTIFICVVFLWAPEHLCDHGLDL